MCAFAGTNFSTETNVLLQLRTRDIIPVDLNSILALNERYLAEFHDILGIIFFVKCFPVKC